VLDGAPPDGDPDAEEADAGQPRRSSAASWRLSLASAVSSLESVARAASRALSPSVFSRPVALESACSSAPTFCSAAWTDALAWVTAEAAVPLGSATV
jgi:hypothetical protein